MKHGPQQPAFFGARAGAILVLAFLFGGCGRAPEETVTREFPGMGTTGSLMVPAADAGRARGWAAKSLATVADLESRLSVFKPDSDLSRVNAAAGGDGVAVSADTLALIQAALAIHRESGGAFDLTVGPLMAAWGFRGKTPPARSPSAGEIAAAMQAVGADHVAITGAMVRLDRPGVRLDAGGIGKGLAVDRCWESLRASDARCFLINLGGNMRASGRPVSTRPWSVGVRNPFQKEKLLGTLRLADGMAVATSGHYERFVTVEGVRYAHIMDPRSGRPVRGMAGVTVLARTAMEADALSTALFVLGPDAGFAMLCRSGRWAEAVFVPDRQPLEAWVTPGLMAWFEPVPGLTIRELNSDRHPEAASDPARPPGPG